MSATGMVMRRIGMEIPVPQIANNLSGLTNGFEGLTVPAAAIGGVTFDTPVQFYYLVLVSILAFSWARRFPYVLVGWLWFLGTLVPVIGLVQVGGQAMADRYTYVPLIGVFIMIAWSLPPAAFAATNRGRVAAVSASGRSSG